MKIRTARRAFLNFRNAKFKKFAILTVLVIATTWGGYGLLRHFASAQNGDFADNVKTFMEMISKKDDGSEKTEFYSGEEIIMNSRIEVSSEGSARSYPNAYFLLKIPKRYLNDSGNNLKITTTSAISSQSAATDNDYYIFRGNYKNLQAGSINSINYILKFKDPETPENYKPEIVHELYSEDGTLLSKQSKVLNTLKYQAASRASLGRYSGTVYITRYTNKENTEIDASLIATQKIKNLSLRNSMEIKDSSGKDATVGRREIKSLEYKINLPEHTQLSEEAIKNGWKFDPVSRTASIVRLKYIYASGYTSSPELSFIYDKDTPKSILGKSVKFKLNTIATFTDGTILNSESSSDFIVDAISFDYNNISTSKGSRIGDGRVLSRYLFKTFDGFSTALATDIDTINYEQNRNFFWLIDFKTTNKGTGERVPLNYIEDHLENNDGYINKVLYRTSSPGYNPFTSLKIDKIDVYARSEGGVESKAGELTLNNQSLDLPKGTKYFRLQFPENTTLPTDSVDIGKENFFAFNAETKFYDIDKIRNSLQPNQEYVVKNRAVFSLEAGKETKESKAAMVLERRVKNVTNNIKTVNDTPLTQIGAKPSFTASYSDTNLQNATHALLFSDKLAVSDKAQKCIDDGKCSLIDNYKNSGNKLLKISTEAIRESSTQLNPSIFFSDSIKVSETTTNGQYKVDFITMWDANNKFRYGDGLDDLDFGEDGNTNSTNIARSSATFTVLKPEQVAIKKFVRKHNSGNFENSVSKLDPADKIDYRISVINISDRPLLTSRVLEVLPTPNDKKIVENNQGVQENRGSQFPIKITGPIAKKEGFTIKYSTDEPGASQTESWNKNFVDENAITDWSAVRMIRIEQNSGHNIPAQTVENFDFTAQIDPNAQDNQIANNSVAVTISASGNLVESDPVTAKVEYPATVEGIAFEDNNKNNVYDENIDTLLPNYTVELFKGYEDKPVQTAKTNAKGHYSFKTKDFAFYRLKFTRTEPLETVTQGSSNSDKASHVVSNSKDATVTAANFTFTDKIKHFTRNIGVFRRRGSVEAKFVDQSGNDLQNKVMVKENALVSENYTATKPAEITKDNLVYVFEKLKDGSAPTDGTVSENTQTVTFVYKPKEGGKVEAKFVKSGTNQEISATETVKPAGVQVGTEYTANSKPEIVENGLKYVYSKVATNSASQNGRVKAESQTVIFEYTPKAGKPVSAISKIVGTNETIDNVAIIADGAQVGTPYSSSPKPEIVHNGITYVFNSLLANSAAQNGRSSEQEQTVLYGYVPKKGGQVLAKYVDKNNNDIKNTKVVKATDTPVGTSYSDEPDLEITSNSGLVYVFEKIKSGAKTGKVEANSKEIVYQYQPKLGKGVTVRLVNSKDKTVLETIKLQEDGKQIGTPFSYSHPKELTDKNGLVYEILPNAKSVNGKTTAESQTFELLYKPKEGGKVEARFINQNGDEIKDTEEIAKAKTQVGTSYSSKHPNQITKDGLVYVFEKLAEKSETEVGKVKVEDQIVVYSYLPEKGGSVIERFVDQNGNPIQGDNILHKTGTQVGTPFESTGVEKIEINGRVYQLKKVEGKQKGAVEADDIIISYVFEDITKISAPNTGISKNIGIFVALIAGVIISIITVKVLKRQNI